MESGEGLCQREQQKVLDDCNRMQLLFLMFRRFTLTEVKELVYRGFEKVTPERWQSLIRHVEETVEDHYWEAL